VPFVIWKNYERESDSRIAKQKSSQTAAESAGETYASMNFLSLLLLREAGIQPQGLFAWNQELFEQCPVVSRNVFYTGGAAKTWDELSPQLQRRIQEYELLQYDILLGENYAGAIWEKANPKFLQTGTPAAKKAIH
jgi:hypothetical protein